MLNLTGNIDRIESLDERCDEQRPNGSMCGGTRYLVLTRLWGMTVQVILCADKGGCDDETT